MSDPVVADSTIASILRDAARRDPDRTALVAGSADPDARRRWTYAEAVAEAERAARALAAAHEPGERIAVVAHSLPEAYLASFAVAMARLVLVPVNPALRPGELAHILGQSGAVAALCVDEHRGVAVADEVAELAAELPALRDVWRISEWPMLLAEGDDATALADPDPDDVAELVFTSGTTGDPKGAMLTHRAMTNAARHSGERFGMVPGDVYVATIPLYHVGGQATTFMAVQSGATVVLVPGFEAGLFLELIETERGTHTAGVPTMLHDAIAHPTFSTRDLSTLRGLSTGGAPVPPDMIRHLEASLGVQTTIMFGQTETCGYVSQTFPDDEIEDKATTVGPVLPHLEVRVVDAETREPVAADVAGELEVRGAGTMVGYHEDADQTAATIGPDGWVRTGDLATMDERGYLRIVGRLKETIVSGGVNVHPAEIERAIAGHPAVAAVAVVGLPDERWGEKVVAVVRAPDGEVSGEDLDAHVRPVLASHKIPKDWIFVDDLPMTASGKVQKFLLLERLAGEAATTDEGATA